MARGKREKKKYKRIEFYSVLILIVISFMSVAYAEISGVDLNITGGVSSEVQEGIFIMDVNYLKNESADVTNSIINNYTETMLDSKIVLGNSMNSSITYQITIYNNTDKEHVFIDTITDKTNPLLYSNENIEYHLEGVEPYITVLNPKTSLTFSITFAYKDGADTAQNILNSKLNFRFMEIPVLSFDNENHLYEIVEIYPNYNSQEYEFTITNFNETSINTVPMNYYFEIKIDKPLTVKIFNENGEEIKDNKIAIDGDGTTKVTHKYKFKVLWDNSNPEQNKRYNDVSYAGKEFLFEVKLKGIPQNTKYEEYLISKQFAGNLSTMKFDIGINIDSTEGRFENSNSSSLHKITLTNNMILPVKYKIRSDSTEDLNVNKTSEDMLVEGNKQNETTITITPVSDYVYLEDASYVDAYVDILEPYYVEKYKDYTIKINTYGSLMRTILEKKYTINTSQPDFRQNITTTANSGVYRATERTGQAYYFRGVISNNYVTFANKIWRIMRVNGDGTVRLIIDTPIGNPTTYNYSTSSTNTDFNSSLVKGTLQSWYQNNLTSYNSYINQQALFIHDRTQSTASSSLFRTWDRLYNASPTINTSGINRSYIYSVNGNSNGNGYLSYPIGLATSDEIMMAGAVVMSDTSPTNPGSVGANPNTTFYIANDIPSGVGLWTMSPYSSTAVMVLKVQVGFYKETPVSGRYLKPVIELNSNITFKGTGTKTNPYRIFQ